MLQAGFEEGVNNVFFWITWFFEIVGAVVIIIGALVCLYKYLRSIIKHKKVPVKMMLANQLALGLEFMLAAEILKTVITTNHTKEEFFMLGAIIILRAALSVLIHWELKNEEKSVEVNEKSTRKLANKSNADV